MPFRPFRLVRAGDTAFIVAPSGPFERLPFEAGLRRLAERYTPSLRDDVFDTYRYLAGVDARRLAELTHALTAPGPHATFAARGGYGVMRLLPHLPEVLKASAPHPVVGFSDVTALHLTLQSQGWISIHGPVLTQLGRQPREMVTRLFTLLESPEPAPPLHGSRTLHPGRAEGPLLGGNLSVLTRLLGTPFMPDLRGALLLLEDVGERPYRIDRMWTHLRLAGVFDLVSGLVLGDFSGCEERGADYSCADVLAALATETGLPCAAGFPIGHTDSNLPVPLGVRARLDAGSRTLEFLEPAGVASHA